MTDAREPITPKQFAEDFYAEAAMPETDAGSKPFRDLFDRLQAEHPKRPTDKELWDWVAKTDIGPKIQSSFTLIDDPEPLDVAEGGAVRRSAPTPTGNGVGGFIQGAIVDPAKALYSGYLGGTSHFTNTLANAAKVVGASGAEQYLRGQAKGFAEESEKTAPAPSMSSSLYSGLGGAVPGMAEYAPAMAAGPAAPIVMGGIGMLGSMDKSTEEMILAGIESTLVGKYLHLAGQKPYVSRIAWGGMPSAVSAYTQAKLAGKSHEEALRDAVAAGGSMAGLMAADPAMAPKAIRTAVTEAAGGLPSTRGAVSDLFTFGRPAGAPKPGVSSSAARALGITDTTAPTSAPQPSAPLNPYEAAKADFPRWVKAGDPNQKVTATLVREKYPKLKVEQAKDLLAWASDKEVSLLDEHSFKPIVGSSGEQASKSAPVPPELPRTARSIDELDARRIYFAGLRGKTVANLTPIERAQVEWDITQNMQHWNAVGIPDPRGANTRMFSPSAPASPPPAAEAAAPKVEPSAGPPPGTTPPTAEPAGGATPAQPLSSAPTPVVPKATKRGKAAAPKAAAAPKVETPVVAEPAVEVPAEPIDVQQLIEAAAAAGRPIPPDPGPFPGKNAPEAQRVAWAAANTARQQAINAERYVDLPDISGISTAPIADIKAGKAAPTPAAAPAAAQPKAPAQPKAAAQPKAKASDITDLSAVDASLQKALKDFGMSESGEINYTELSNRLRELFGKGGPAVPERVGTTWIPTSKHLFEEPVPPVVEPAKVPSGIGFPENAPAMPLSARPEPPPVEPVVEPQAPTVKLYRVGDSGKYPVGDTRDFQWTTEKPTLPSEQVVRYQGTLGKKETPSAMFATKAAAMAVPGIRNVKAVTVDRSPDVYSVDVRPEDVGQYQAAETPGVFQIPVEHWQTPPPAGKPSPQPAITVPTAERPISRAQEVFAPAERRYASEIPTSAPAPVLGPEGRLAYLRKTYPNLENVPAPKLPAEPFWADDLPRLGYTKRARMFEGKEEIFSRPVVDGTIEIRVDPDSKDWIAYKHFQSASSPGSGKASLTLEFNNGDASLADFAERLQKTEVTPEGASGAKPIVSPVAGLRPLSGMEPDVPRQSITSIAPDPAKVIAEAMAKATAAGDAATRERLGILSRVYQTVKTGTEQYIRTAQRQVQEARSAPPAIQKKLAKAAQKNIDKANRQRDLMKAVMEGKEGLPSVSDISRDQTAFEAAARARMEPGPGEPPELIRQRLTAGGVPPVPYVKPPILPTGWKVSDTIRPKSVETGVEGEKAWAIWNDTKKQFFALEKGGDPILFESPDTASTAISRLAKDISEAPVEPPKPRGRTSELAELVQSSPYKIDGNKANKGGYVLVDKATGQEVEAHATKIGSSLQVRLVGVRDPIKTVSTANQAHIEMLKAQRQWDLDHGRTWEGMVEAVKEARRAPTPEEAGPLPEFGGAPLPDISGIAIPEAKGAPAPVDVSTLPDISGISTKRITEVPPTLPATVAKAAAAAPKKASAPKPVVQPKPTAEPVASAPEPGLQPGRTYVSPKGSDDLGILSGDRLTYLGREGQVAKFRDADTGSVVRITATEQELLPVLGGEAPIGPPPLSEGRRATQRGALILGSDKPKGGPGEPVWTAPEIKRFRDEIERRFRERTQALREGRTVNPEEVDPSFRVTQSEMRTWAEENLGKRPPIEEQFFKDQNKWYERMARKVSKEGERGSWSEKPAEGEPPSWADAEKDAIQRAIAFTGGNIKAAAQHLGMGRTSIYRKIQQYGLAAREFLKDEKGEANYGTWYRRNTNAAAWVSPDGKANEFQWGGVSGNDTHATIAIRILKENGAGLGPQQRRFLGEKSQKKLLDTGWAQVHGASITVSPGRLKTGALDEAVRVAEKNLGGNPDGVITVWIGNEGGDVPVQDIPKFLSNPLIYIRRYGQYKHLAKSEPAPAPMGIPEPVLA